VMYIGPPRSEEEYDERHAKVRYGRKHYRVHKELGDGSKVRLITMDGESTIDVFRHEITVLSMEAKRRQNARIRQTVRKLIKDALQL
jgi:hypothetical protein